jgi:uncharacterized protein YqgC (DUF456 family)
MLEVFLFVLGLVLIVAGLIGCILPVLPGTPLSYAGLVVLWGSRGWHANTFGWELMLVLGMATVLVTILDYVAPIYGAKRFGASKSGIWGSVIGMVVGIIGLLPVGPLGMLVGAFVGAWVGEILAGKETGPALKAAWGVFVGTVVGIVLKLVVSVAITVYWVIELVS